MSEYQYYEFQTSDRPLTEEEQAVMRQLSSRVVLTPTSAAFTYNYGDFRGDPKKVLAQYFDAMLYMANWGSKQVEETEAIYALLNSDAISPDFVRRLVKQYGDESIASVFLIDSGDDKTYLDYLLRRYKGHFYRNRYPQITLV